MVARCRASLVFALFVDSALCLFCPVWHCNSYIVEEVAKQFPFLFFDWNVFAVPLGFFFFFFFVLTES